MGSDFSAEYVRINLNWASVIFFERFYQVDKTSEGSGLGLAIAKAIAQRNHWGLLAQSNGGVTSFRVVW